MAEVKGGEMNILVIGSGGREHALAWKLAEPDYVTRVFVAPGNAGTAEEPKLENVPLDPMDIEGLAQFAKTQDCALTVVGPEAPLVAGIVDHFTEHGLACFGPTAGAAQLEVSDEGHEGPGRRQQRTPWVTAVCV